MTRKNIFIFLLIFYCAFLYAIETDKLKIQMCAIPGTNYQLSSTEVTQCLFEEVTGENPSANINPNYPVECVSYYDVIYFCNKLSVLMGYEPVYVIEGETDILMAYQPFYNLEIDYKIEINENADGFRIPTIKEWQYAAKGGENYKYPGSDNIDDIAIVKPYDPEESHEYEVAQKKPNGYGLYDMSGNVSEWVMDPYADGLNYTCGACFAAGYEEGFEITSLGYGSRKYSRGDIGIRLLRANIKKVASSNLRLRTNEAKDNETICIMSKGSQIKILEFGSPETIDGISSNWVKVEVQSDAKDSDGKPIKAGTVGWCFGGYLAETTEANKFESTDTKEISDIKEELKTMILELSQPEIAFFNESDLIFVCESKFLLPNYNIILSLWLFEGDFFLIYVIFNNSKFDKLFGIPMITSLDGIEKNFQYSSMFKQIERFNIPKISAFIYDYNHDGIDDILYLGVSYMTGYIHFIISGLSINLEKIEMFNIGKFPNFQVYPEFINYKCRQGIKYFDGEQFVFYYYDRIKQEYVQDETAISEELEQIHGSPDFFAEAGIDYTKLERSLLPSDLEGFSKPALRIWRNAVYARHGRTFKSEDLQALFNEYAWYKPDENYSDEKLTDIDKANIKLIQEFENK